MGDIVEKLVARTYKPGPSGISESFQAEQDREVIITVEAGILEGMKKRAEVTCVRPEGSTFSIMSDEGAYLNGEDSAPSPLAYFSAGIAF